MSGAPDIGHSDWLRHRDDSQGTLSYPRGCHVAHDGFLEKRSFDVRRYSSARSDV